MFADEDLIIFTDEELDKILAAFGHLNSNYFQHVLSLLKQLTPAYFASSVIDSFYRLVTSRYEKIYVKYNDEYNTLHELIDFVDGFGFHIDRKKAFCYVTYDR